MEVIVVKSIDLFVLFSLVLQMSLQEACSVGIFSADYITSRENDSWFIDAR